LIEGVGAGVFSEGCGFWLFEDGERSSGGSENGAVGVREGSGGFGVTADGEIPSKSRVVPPSTSTVICPLDGAVL
jgi:hypothetical protein